jgi:hypothetical protein
MRARWFILSTLATACGACAHGPSSAPASRSAPAPAPESASAPESAPALRALESRLLSARTFRIRARLASSGRIQSNFEGSLVAGDGPRVRVAFEGAFGGRDASARLVCDGRKMRGGNREQTSEFDAPPALREGFVVAFVRMGLLHEVAMLAMGEMPDVFDGKEPQRLEVVGATHDAGEPVRGAPTERWSWALLVDHRKTADEQLWLDARTGLPLRRRVTVHFSEGDMDAGEEYDEVTLDAPVDETTFALAP